MSESILKKTDPSNYVEMYLETRAAALAYMSKAPLSGKREIAESVSQILETFLNYTPTDQEIDELENMIENNEELTQFQSAQKGDLFQKLNHLAPDGIKLLELTFPITPQDLKKKYYKACQNHHPDKGGMEASMKRVNEVYSLYMDFLTNHLEVELEGRSAFVPNTPSSIKSWEFTCCLILTYLYGDLFAADKAYDYLRKVEDLLNFVPAKYGSKIIKIMFHNCDIYSTVKVLGRFEMSKEFDEAVRITLSLIQMMYNHWHKINEYDMRPTRDFFPDAKKLKEEFGVKLVLNHPLKVAHAFRLGIIGEKKYLELLEKYDEKKSHQDLIRSKVAQFYQTGGGAYLLPEKPSMAKSDIHQPIEFSQDRLEHLNDAQAYEYASCFAGEIDFQNYFKFYRLRATEMMLTLITNFTTTLSENIKKGASMYIKLKADPKNYFTNIENACDYLQSLDKNELIERLLILKRLDHSLKREWNPFLAMMSDQLEGRKSLRIEPTDFYLHSIKQPIMKLYLYLV